MKELLTRVLGAEPPSPLTSMNSLSHTWKFQGPGEEAMDLMMQAVLLSTFRARLAVGGGGGGGLLNLKCCLDQCLAAFCQPCGAGFGSLRMKRVFVGTEPRRASPPIVRLPPNDDLRPLCRT